MRVIRTRAERFGAMVATEDPPALVAVNRQLAKRLGVSGGALWESTSPGLDVARLEGPSEAHLSVTERCPAACTGCYAAATPEGHEPDREDLKARLRTLRELGTFSVAFGGGEGALRDDISELAAFARSLGMTPTLTTSGIGINSRNASRFAPFAQVNVSYDGPGEVYASVRGYEGAAGAERAIEALQAAGVPVGINTVLTRSSFEHLEQTIDKAESLGVVEAQLLRFKPSGRGQLDYLARRLSPGQVDALGPTLRAISVASPIGLRIDCSLVPFLAHRLDPEDLRRFGVMGCEPGRSLLTVDAHGKLRPCSFWDSAGDVLSEQSWSDSALQPFVDFGSAPPEPCASCPARSVCRGGCKVVSLFMTGSFSPDPECPRVRASAQRDCGNDQTDAM